MKKWLVAGCWSLVKNAMLLSVDLKDLPVRSALFNGRKGDEVRGARCAAMANGAHSPQPQATRVAVRLLPLAIDRTFTRLTP